MSQHSTRSSQGSIRRKSFEELREELSKIANPVSHHDPSSDPFSHRPLARAALYSLSQHLVSIDMATWHSLQQENIPNTDATYASQIEATLRNLVNAYKRDNRALSSDRVNAAEAEILHRLYEARLVGDDAFNPAYFQPAPPTYSQLRAPLRVIGSHLQQNRSGKYGEAYSPLQQILSVLSSIPEQLWTSLCETHPQWDKRLSSGTIVVDAIERLCSIVSQRDSSVYKAQVIETGQEIRKIFADAGLADQINWNGTAQSSAFVATTRAGTPPVILLRQPTDRDGAHPPPTTLA